MNHKELATKIARDLMTGSDDGVMGARLKIFDGAGEYMGGWSLDGITHRIEQFLDENLDDPGPSADWNVPPTSDREDQCESISAGGLAADMGMIRCSICGKFVK